MIVFADVIKDTVNANGTYEHVFFTKEIGKTVFVDKDKAKNELNRILNAGNMEDN